MMNTMMSMKMNTTCKIIDVRDEFLSLAESTADVNLQYNCEFIINFIHYNVICMYKYKICSSYCSRVVP